MKPIHMALTLAGGLLLPQTATADDAGHLLAQSCAGCHGQEGAGVGAAPAIAGISAEDFIAMWAEFQADERPATIMNRIARGYTDEEIAALAAYFAAKD
ncbi:MAG: c-type cytochrome [Rubellimicrobium sp.]|nr:c-type cytochrome [Rubellimicrobium sp.]